MVGCILSTNPSWRTNELYKNCRTPDRRDGLGRKQAESAIKICPHLDIVLSPPVSAFSFPPIPGFGSESLASSQQQQKQRTDAPVTSGEIHAVQRELQGARCVQRAHISFQGPCVRLRDRIILRVSPHRVRCCQDQSRLYISIHIYFCPITASANRI